MGQRAIGIGMMRRRQLNPRWENDLVWLHDVSRQESGQKLVRAPPQTEIRQRADNAEAG